MLVPGAGAPHTGGADAELPASPLNARFVAINHGAWDLHTNIYDKAQKSNQYTLSHDLDTGLSELMAEKEQAWLALARSQRTGLKRQPIGAGC